MTSNTSPSTYTPVHPLTSPNNCPFCNIVSSYPPQPPDGPSSSAFDTAKTSPPSYVILSTPSVIAFLDIAPLSRGHVLVSPRRHAVKMGDLTPSEGAEMGRVLPLLTRATMRAVMPDVPVDEADYNIVQNNGPRAAQIIPHVHYHIIPRPPDQYPAAPKPSQKSWLVYGRGQRHELDDDDAEKLVVVMRERIAEEWRRAEEMAERDGKPKL